MLRYFMGIGQNDCLAYGGIFYYYDKPLKRLPSKSFLLHCLIG